MQCQRTIHTATTSTASSMKHAEDEARSGSGSGSGSGYGDSYTRCSELTPASVSVRSAAKARSALAAIRDALDGGRARKAEERGRVEAEVLRHLAELERAKDEEMAEMRLKLAGRDAALSSLERTVEMQGRTIRMLRSDLDDRDRDRELQGDPNQHAGGAVEALRAAHALQLDAARREADALRRKVHDKKKVILHQNRQMREFQAYIVELTDELERLYNEIDDANNNHNHNHAAANADDDNDDDAGATAAGADDARTVGAESVMRHRQELERRLQLWENGGGGSSLGDAAADQSDA